MKDRVSTFELNPTRILERSGSHRKTGTDLFLVMRSAIYVQRTAPKEKNKSVPDFSRGAELGPNSVLSHGGGFVSGKQHHRPPAGGASSAARESLPQPIEIGDDHLTIGLQHEPAFPQSGHYAADRLRRGADYLCQY